MLKKTWMLVVVFCILLAGCAAPQPTPTASPSPLPVMAVATAESTMAVEPSATVEPTLTQEAVNNASLWIDKSVPGPLREAVSQNQNVTLAASAEESTMQLTVVSAGEVQSAWIYALVAPFPTVIDEVSSEELKQSWLGTSPGPFNGSPLFMTAETKAAFTLVWGEPAEGRVQVRTKDEVVTAVWDERPSWAIVPFEDLEPRWKVLKVDGQSPVEKEFNADLYPLYVPYGLVSTSKDVRFGLASNLLGVDNLSLPATNRDPNKMTVLVMTGVSALVRGTAYKMDQKGITYPAQDIRDWLRNADITHISNEVSFYDQCPDASPEPGPLYFCSKSSYIQLFEDVGADIIELTGNHNNDSAQVYGVDVVPANLQMYQERGMKYYAGGLDLAEARQPALIEDHGNKLAFIGCNPAGPDYAWAYEDKPGAAPCGDYQWMKDEIARLRDEGYLPIATFQYFENYSNKASEQMRHDFEQMADSGAVIVQGSQAHTPKEMEFVDNSFVHYGLGNLFFDQMWVNESYLTIGKEEIPATRLEFIDRHIIYDGRYISTELLTAMLQDYAKPRPMTEEERTAFLKNIFEASGW